MIAGPARISEIRGPRAATSRPETGAKTQIITAMGRVSIPACRAL